MTTTRNDHGHGTRNDALDGLRFVAVAAVLAFHFGVPGAQAGFLGVDLFFVLSGFLITDLLLRQVEGGSVRLGQFWARRVRRLAPALVLGLAAVIAWGALEASMTSRDALRADITATLAYVANWHFIGSSDYFDEDGEESPLQHMWTLAVEEQFYVAWPLALFLIALLVRPPRARLALVAALALGGIVVSAWRLHVLWAGSETSDRAFMGTDSRIFEPLVGAFLAVILICAPRLGGGRGANTALTVLGSATLVWAMLELGSPTGPRDTYAGGGALLFALGSAALIWAVSTRISRASAMLSLPPVTYLGRISYGIYIWHWPLVVWSDDGWGWFELAGAEGMPRALALTAATVALASVSYHAVEKPIRYGALGTLLDGRRIAVVLPAVLGGLIAVNTTVVVPHAGAEIVTGTKAERGTTTEVSNVTKTVLLVGDSVPQALSDEFADAAATRQWVVIKATAGGCPATAVQKVYASGERFKRNTCPPVAGRQDAKVEQYRPALVIWWSRFELAPRLGPDGKVLRLGGRAYWRAQRAAFTKRARALTRLGARLVAVQIEPAGHALARRNPSERSFLVGRTLIHRWDLARTWNAFLARHAGPTTFSVSIDALVCRDRRSPCDDRLPNGRTARPDGVHYSDEAGRPLASKIFEAARRVAGLPG